MSQISCARCGEKLSNSYNVIMEHICKANEPASGSPKQSVVQSVTDTDDRRILPVQSARTLAELKRYAINESHAATRLFDSMKHSRDHGDIKHCAMCLGRRQAFEAMVDRIEEMERDLSTAESKEANLARAD